MKVASFLDRVAEAAAASLAYVWPAFGGNAVTESNIRTALTQVAAGVGFASYSELPLTDPGVGSVRIDYAALRYTPSGATHILAETKTDGAGDANIRRWLEDFRRLRAWDLTRAAFNWLEKRGPPEVLWLSLFWTDNAAKKQRIVEELAPAPDGRVTKATPFGVPIGDASTFLVDTEVGWDLRLYSLTSALEFGRTAFPK